MARLGEDIKCGPRGWLAKMDDSGQWVKAGGRGVVGEQVARQYRKGRLRDSQEKRTPVIISNSLPSLQGLDHLSKEHTQLWHGAHFASAFVFNRDFLRSPLHKVFHH